MLDQNLFINDYEETKRRLTRKKVSVDQIEEIRKAILDRKAFIGEIQWIKPYHKAVIPGGKDIKREVKKGKWVKLKRKF